MRFIFFFLICFKSFAFSDDIYLKTGYVFRNVAVIDSANGILSYVQNGKNAGEALSIVLRIELKPVDPNSKSIFELYSKKQNELWKSTSLTDSSLSNKLPLMQGTKPLIMKERDQKPAMIVSDSSTYYPNMKLLPIVFLASAVAWNDLATASDAQSAIDANNKIAKTSNIQADNSHLENTKSRNQIIGYVSIVTACITLGLCFSDAQVEVKQNSISMRVTF